LQVLRHAWPHGLAQAPDPVDLARGLRLSGPSHYDHATGQEDEEPDHETLNRSPLRVSRREPVTSYMGVSVEWGHRGVNATGPLGVRPRLCPRRPRLRGPVLC